VARGDRARSPGAKLSQAVGLDERQQLRPVGGEQRDHEASAVPKAHVRLQAGDAELEVGCSHHVQEAVLEAQPETWTILDHAAREPLEARLHGGDRIRGLEQRFDVGLVQVQGHAAD
jgi:hypothetical protein